MTILYCDCFSGISGDMFLGAMLDAGMSVEHLSDQLNLLGLEEFHGAAVEKVQKGAVSATLIRFDLREHEHDHDHHHEHHAHHRHPGDIRRLIENSALSDRVKRTSLDIFQKLAEAEAKVHGTTIEEVHFHEVGAVDSILDIVGAAIGLEYFDVRSFFSSDLPLGAGQVMTQHGILPLPAPATLELIRMAQAPVRPSKSTVELVTPTGAAILSTLAAFSQPEMKITHVGIGAGQRDLEWPNILRIMIGDANEAIVDHIEIQTNIDDMNPQIFGHVMDKLFKAGALDVFFTPIFMKKNRPAVKLSVIARKTDEDTICNLILRETSTLGVRINQISRHEAGREIRTIETRYGPIPVKLKTVDGVILQAAPEFDACVRLAEQAGVPVTAILQEASANSLIFITAKHV